MLHGDPDQVGQFFIFFTLAAETKLNIHGIFIWHHECYVDFLCTFSLGHLSTGPIDNSFVVCILCIKAGKWIFPNWCITQFHAQRCLFIFFTFILFLILIFDFVFFVCLCFYFSSLICYLYYLYNFIYIYIYFVFRFANIISENLP